METNIAISPAEAQSRSFVTKVYMWMGLGLALTGWIAGTVGTNQQLVMTLVTNKVLFYGLIIGELLLVIGLSAGINRMTAGAATLAFFVYAAFNGATLSVIFLAYTASSIASTFFVTAGTFGAMSLYGYTTKRDLTSIGNMLTMALFGFILASIVNMFLNNPTVTWITTYAGILIFVGLTAYDTQSIKRMSGMNFDDESFSKAAVMGALKLYLDFINLFLLILRATGNRR